MPTATAEPMIEAGLIVRNTPAARLYERLQDSLDEVQPYAGDVADVLLLCDPKAKVAVAFAARVEAAKKFARDNRAGPQWVGLPLDCTTAELRDLLTAAGAKV